MPCRARIFLLGWVAWGGARPLPLRGTRLLCFTGIPQGAKAEP